MPGVSQAGPHQQEPHQLLSSVKENGKAVDDRQPIHNQRRHLLQEPDAQPGQQSMQVSQEGLQGR